MAERVVVVPAGTACAEAVAAAKCPMAGPNAIVVVRGQDGRLRDLDWVPEVNVEVEPVAMSSPDGLTVLRHSAAHVLAQAVQDVYPEAKLGIGPPIENGFYYDFDVARPFQPDDLVRIESRMQEIVKSGQKFHRRAFLPSTPPRPSWSASPTSSNSSTSRATSTLARSWRSAVAS